MLVQQHAAPLYRLATGIVGVTDAHDITQEALTTAWRELPKLRDADRFTQWVRRICVNRCRAHLRSRRSASISLEAGHAAEIAGSGDFRDAVDARAVIGPAIERLAPDQRAVLALHYGLGLSIAESADAMNVRVGTAKSRLNAALRAMRVVLEPGGTPARAADVADERMVSQ
jgi:RNA polymerase sigma factor (sigma-70 family)